MVKGDERKRSFGRIACERSGVEEIRRGQRGGFGGEQVEKSCVEVWNRVWQMRTELN
jgi:hypothetical protein